MDNKEDENLKKSNRVFEFLQKYGMIFWLIISLCAVVMVVVYIFGKNNNDNDVKYVYVNPESGADESKSQKSGKSTDKASKTTKKEKTQKTTSLKSEKTKETTKEKSVPTTMPLANFPLEINSVKEYELIQISGIGENYARKIIDYRNQIGIIYNMDLLKNIDGIGDGKLNILKKYLYVDEKYYKAITEKTTITKEKFSDDNEKSTASENGTTVSTTVKTTSETLSQSQESEAEEGREEVNVNEADAEEISEKLLIDISMAEDIVILRNKLERFSDPLELLYVKGISKKLLEELLPYLVI